MEKTRNEYSRTYTPYRVDAEFTTITEFFSKDLPQTQTC
jgi:hypothetical protein